VEFNKVNVDMTTNTIFRECPHLTLPQWANNKHIQVSATMHTSFDKNNGWMLLPTVEEMKKVVDLVDQVVKWRQAGEPGEVPSLLQVRRLVRTRFLFSRSN
jgi:hypothetical protein